jgi:hypothetical protein
LQVNLVTEKRQFGNYFGRLLEIRRANAPGAFGSDGVPWFGPDAKTFFTRT